MKKKILYSEDYIESCYYGLEPNDEYSITEEEYVKQYGEQPDWSDGHWGGD